MQCDVPQTTLNGLSISYEAAVQRLAGDPVRDTLLVNNTPIDYLDFASPVSGLGGKMGLDATNKWPGETQREWGTPIVMDETVKRRVDEMWAELGL